jgi:hypothetical protein
MRKEMELTDKQIEFMKRMEKEILPNRRNIGYDQLISVGSLVGISINTCCRNRVQKSGTDLLNLYGSLRPTYDKWLVEQSKKEDIYTDFEVGLIVEKITEETIKDIVVSDDLPILNDFKEVGKTEEYHKLDVERTEEVSKIIKKQLKKKDVNS